MTGYVRLVDTMGTDLTVVNTARVSFDKESSALSLADEKLIEYIVKHGHNSCLRHCVMTFEIYAPMMVKNQWIKHMVASAHVEDQNGWNETCLPAWQELWSYGGICTVQDILDGKQIPLRSLSDSGEIVPNRVKKVWPSGEQEVFRIKDNFGNTVNLTSNHRVKTPNGWTPVSDLTVGDKIGHNGVPAYTDENWLTKMAQTHTAVQIADICDVSPRTIHFYKSRFGISTDANVGKLYTDKGWLTENYQTKNHTLTEVAAMANCSPHTIRKWAKRFGIQKDNVAVLKEYVKTNGTFIPDREQAFERAQKAVKTKQSRYGRARHRAGDSANYRRIGDKLGWKKCLYCDSDLQEIHHRDGNRDNNSVDNLIPLCSKHHYLIHGKRPAVSGYGEIISKESIGMHMTYDIEMALEDNFVAGGIIVHNSRRYVTENEVFYVPEHFLAAPANKKQGAGEPVDEWTNDTYRLALTRFQEQGVKFYKQAIADGIAPEEARLFLPAYGLYIRWRWTASLNAILNFLDLRLDKHAQSQIRAYATAVEQEVSQAFPITYKAWKNK